MPTVDLNPYYDWLGIPLERQPPNHYALLGLDELEDNPAAIDSAAEQRVVFLKTKQIGQNQPLAERIIKEVMEAHRILATESLKSTYDHYLQQEQPVDSKPQVDPPQVPMSAPVREAASDVATPSLQWFDYLPSREIVAHMSTAAFMSGGLMVMLSHDEYTQEIRSIVGAGCILAAVGCQIIASIERLDG